MIEIIGAELYQWDTGRSVKVTGIEASKVHFANQGDSKAPIMDIVNDEAKIPDYLLQTGKQLCVYAVANGVTIERKIFSVIKRERPENYVYEEDQRNYIYELITNAENATNEANTAAENAKVATARATVATENANVATNNANLAADSANKAAVQAAHTAKSLMVVGNAKGEIITLDNAIDQFLVGCRIFGKTTQDGTPTPDAPVELVSVGDGGNIEVTVSGKNLAKVIHAKSLTTRYGSLINIEPIKLYKGVSYAVSFDTENTGISCYINPQSFTYKVFQMDGKRKSFVFTYTEDKTMGYDADGSTILVTRDSATSDVASGLISNVQIEAVNSATEYEPYKGQSLTISTPNRLLGIPVTSGGNYTDSKGKRWICDEIDFARGVYVQRVGTLVLDGAGPWLVYSSAPQYYGFIIDGVLEKTHNRAGGLCNQFYIEKTVDNSVWVGVGNKALYVISSEWYNKGLTAWKEHLNTNPLHIIYRLVTPIETPLSEEELAAYASLHTYRGNTTVSNDAGAYMELEYVMDAKKYIDSKIASAILPATVE